MHFLEKTVGFSIEKMRQNKELKKIHSAAPPEGSGRHSVPILERFAI